MRIEAVLNSAKVLGWRTGENPALWRGNLDAALPPRGKVRTVKHHAALPWREISPFMAQLRQRDGLSARALEFTILTAARSGEVRNVAWSEIDFEQELWIVPAKRMKAGREHRVPLSQSALQLLDEMPRFQGYDLIFPGTRMQPLSDMSLSQSLSAWAWEALRCTGLDLRSETGLLSTRVTAAISWKWLWPTRSQARPKPHIAVGI